MKQWLESIYLGWRDWKHEYLLSLCAVLALASMLAPILVLEGVKNGVLAKMRSQILEDPTALIITPKSDAGKFSTAFIEEIGKLPGASYIIGRTRYTSTDSTIFNSSSGKHVRITFEPSSPGEPVLSHYNISAPKNGPEPEMVLSHPAARALGVKTGDMVTAKIGRKTPQGKFETWEAAMHIGAILPQEAADGKMAFVPLQFLEDMENYRDYIAVPDRGLEGDQNDHKRDYSSFRLYAKNLDAVESLAQDLEARNIETSTRARDIAVIRMLGAAINSVILIIAFAVAAGFTAFMVSSVQSAISRKIKMLGLLRLLGIRSMPLTLFPLTQTILTALGGLGLSLLLYKGVSIAIGFVFSKEGINSNLELSDIAIVAAAIFILTLLSSLGAAKKAACVEPSIALREI